MFVWSSKLTAYLLQIGSQRANLALVALSASLGAGRLLATLWLRWLTERTTILVSAVAAAAGASLVYSANSLTGMLAGFVLLGLGLSAIFPTALALVGNRFRETGTVFGAIMTVALIGGTAGPSVGAWLAKTGLERILYVPLVSAVAVLALSLIITSRDATVS